MCVRDVVCLSTVCVFDTISPSSESLTVIDLSLC